MTLFAEYRGDRLEALAETRDGTVILYADAIPADPEAAADKCAAVDEALNHSGAQRTSAWAEQENGDWVATIGPGLA